MLTLRSQILTPSDHKKGDQHSERYLCDFIAFLNIDDNMCRWPIGCQAKSTNIIKGFQHCKAKAPTWNKYPIHMMSMVVRLRHQHRQAQGLQRCQAKAPTWNRYSTHMSSVVRLKHRSTAVRQQEIYICIKSCTYQQNNHR